MTLRVAARDSPVNGTSATVFRLKDSLPADSLPAEGLSLSSEVVGRARQGRRGDLAEHVIIVDADHRHVLGHRQPPLPADFEQLHCPHVIGRYDLPKRGPPGMFVGLRGGPYQSSGVAGRAKPGWLKRGQHRASGRQDDESERSARWHGLPRPHQLTRKNLG